MGERTQLPVLVLRQFELLVVVVKVRRIVEVGVRLVEVAKEGIETLLPRHPFGTDITEAPFAKASGAVAGGAEDLTNGLIRIEDVDAARIRAHRGMPAMQACHQYAARRGTDGTTGVGVGAANPVASDGIDMRRLDDFLPIAAGVGPSHIVGHDPNDVRRLASGGGQGRGEREKLAAQHARRVYLRPISWSPRGRRHRSAGTAGRHTSRSGFHGSTQAGAAWSHACR